MPPGHRLFYGTTDCPVNYSPLQWASPLAWALIDSHNCGSQRDWTCKFEWWQGWGVGAQCHLRTAHCVLRGAPSRSPDQLLTLTMA